MFHLKTLTVLMISVFAISSIQARRSRPPRPTKPPRYVSQAIRFLIPIDSNVIFQINEGQNLPALPRDNFKVLVWNMYKGAEESWAEDYKKIIQGQDILMLQELLTDDNMTPVFKADQERTYYLATSFFDKWNNLARSGVATASHYEALEVDWHRSFHREPVVRTPKMSSVVTYALEDSEKTLLTINIHAINFVSKSKLFHMVNQGLEAAAKHDGPVIFAGDFNTWSSGKLKGVYEMMKKAGFSNVKFENDERMKTFGRVLDHIFVRDLKINSSRVYGEIEGADHKAMEATLSYEGI